ncbi:MAG: zinc metallopeptidase, partial [Anaerococcus sp.]|nr:zinc metallopeptidase [Anaerococcus sp.]
MGIISDEDLKGTREVLSAAALTYVASTLVAIGQFLRLLSIFGRRD